MKKLLIIIFLSLMWNGNTFAEKFKLPEGILVPEKSFIEKILDKFTGPKKSTKAKKDIFSLTCEGEIVTNLYNNYSLFDNKKEIFFEDFEIEIRSYKKEKKISEVHMTNSSHPFGRDVWYYLKDIDYSLKGDIYKKNLSVSRDNMQINLVSKNRDYDPDGDLIKSNLNWNESPSRISLKSGTYSGQIRGEKGDLSAEVQFRSKCAGGLEIIKFISTDRNSYLDYWWAVILIIAITFFIFTQSGKRLKKIRRK